MRAALRRVSLLLIGVVGGTVFVSALAGLALGSSLSRSVSLGFYVVGSFLLVAGFFLGNRGPLRTKAEVGPSLFGAFGARTMRRATPEEQHESINTSALFVVIGLVLIILGVLADPRYRLV